MMEIEKSSPLFPPCLEKYQIRIFVNGCVERGEGSRFRAKAHAHVDGKNKGWVCFLSVKRLFSKELCLHEAAHIVYGRKGHTDGWRACLLEMGGTLDEVPGILKSYHKKKRGEA